MREIRMIMPRLGGKKLYYLLKEQLMVLNVGRDKLFRILRANHMLIEPRKRYHITTDSHHRFRKHKNLVSTIEIEKPDAVWVSDITYVGTRTNPYYLALNITIFSISIFTVGLRTIFGLKKPKKLYSLDIVKNIDVPCPNVDSIQIFPPCKSSTIFLQ